MSYLSDGSRENSSWANREQEAQQRREIFDVVHLCHVDEKNVMIERFEEENECRSDR